MTLAQVGLVFVAALIVGLIVHAARWYRELGTSRLIFRDPHINRRDWDRIMKPAPPAAPGLASERQRLDRVVAPFSGRRS